jgi:hypothetical protein
MPSRTSVSRASSGSDWSAARGSLLSGPGQVRQDAHHVVLKHTCRGRPGASLAAPEHLDRADMCTLVEGQGGAFLRGQFERLAGPAVVM